MATGTAPVTLAESNPFVVGALPGDVSAWDADAQAAYGGPATEPDPIPDVAVAALAYAARGWPVFPAHTVNADGRCSCGNAGCRDAAKHPIAALAPRGLHDATTDQATLGRWWAAWPNANVAVRTGAEGGVIVVDVDAANGGWESSDRLEAGHGPWPDTPTASTGGCGAHLYLRHPGGTVRNSVGRIAPGVDVRGDGGYVIAPPSQHRSGARYAWVAGFEPEAVLLADPPPWLLPWLVDRPVTGAAPPPARCLPPGDLLSEGERNVTLTSLGGSMRRRGFTEGAILAALQAENVVRCRPPLDAAEVARIAGSVARYAPETAGPILRVGGVELPVRRGGGRRRG